MTTDDLAVAPATFDDMTPWLALRAALWPDCPEPEHRAEIASQLADSSRYRALLARTPAGETVAFAEAAIRTDPVNGTDGSPVAFLEGLYVAPAWRRRGVARRLVAAVADWGAARGCRELGSDALLDNVDSHAMHRALGFEETERVVYFRRMLRVDARSASAVPDRTAVAALLHAFVDAVNARDWQALEALVTDDFRRHSAAAGEPAVRSRADLVAFLRAEHAIFPDGRETLLDLVIDGDRAAARHRFEGSQRGPMGPWPASGRRLAADYLAIYRIADHRLAEAWTEWDSLAALRQLGHLPASFPG